MQVEQTQTSALPAPGLARFTWLLFMQPLQLSRLLKTWGMQADPSLPQIWPLFKTRDAIARTILSQCALLLFGVWPLTILTVASTLMMLGVRVHWIGVGVSMVLAFVMGVVAGATREMRIFIKHFTSRSMARSATKAGSVFGVGGALIGLVFVLAIGADTGSEHGLVVKWVVVFFVATIAGVLSFLVFFVMFFVATVIVFSGARKILAFSEKMVSRGVLQDTVDVGVVSGTVTSIAYGTTLCLALSVEDGIAVSIWIGTVLGVLLGGQMVTTGNALDGRVVGMLIFAAGLAASLGHSVWGEVIRNAGKIFTHGVDITKMITHGLVASIVCCVFYVRLPLYPIEAGVSLFLWYSASLQPKEVERLARWLPFRHHDLVFLPLPGLRSFLLQVAVIDPPLASALIAEAATSIGQKGIARWTLIELQAREIEHAAQRCLFNKVSDLKLTFVPSADTLDTSSPLLRFQAAARDMLAGGNDHHQRRLALERAYKTLNDFIGNTTTAPRRDTLSQRLLPVAHLWLEIVRDEQHKLAKEERESPQVPRPFIAGLPLDPDDVRGKSLFKGRKDLARIVNHELDPDRRGVLVIVGQRRMGKSSFRNWLPRLLGTGTDILSSDFQQLTGHPHRATPHRWLVDLVASRFPQAPPPPDSPHWTESLAWLRARDETLADRRLLVVVDEVERVEEGIQRGEFSTDFLDFLRASGDALRRIRFLLLTAYPLQRLGRHWVDRLISATERNLSYLDRTSAEELIRQPIPQFPDIYPEGGVDRILHETHCHPFLVQKVCDELCSHLNEHGGRRRATDDELTNVLDRIVTGEKLFDELWSQRTPDEQRALQRLACATEPLEADPAMRQLSREGYVELQGDKATLAVPVWGAWIRFTQGRVAP